MIFFGFPIAAGLFAVLSIVFLSIAVIGIQFLTVIPEETIDHGFLVEYILILV